MTGTGRGHGFGHRPRALCQAALFGFALALGVGCPAAPVASPAAHPKAGDLAPARLAPAGRDAGATSATPDGGNPDATSEARKGADAAVDAPVAVADAAPVADADVAPRPAKVSWIVVPVDHTDCCAMALLPDGGVLALGENEYGTSSSDDMFLSRLDSAGHTVWHKRAMGRYIRTLSVAAGHAFVTTEFSGRVHLGRVRVRGPGGIDVFVGKLDLSGSARWGRVFSTWDYDRVHAAAPTPDGGVVVALGAFVSPRSGPFVFKPAGGEDALVAKWNGAGKFLWLKSFHWHGNDTAASIVTGARGSLFVAGTRWRSPSTGAYSTANGPCHGWVARLAPDGKTRWLRDLGSAWGHLEIELMARAPGDRLVVAGSLYGTAKVGGTTFHARRVRPYVAVLDSAGNVLWARAEPVASCVTVDAAGRILLGGTKGIVVARRSGSQPWLLHFPKDMYDVQSCVADGAHYLYVSGDAAPHAAFGGARVPAPRRIRFGFLPRFANGFVAKLAH